MYIQISMESIAPKPEHQWAESSSYPCLCAVVRKAGRVLTNRYDHHLKPGGLKVTQFSMLANIGRNPGITVSELADLLLMDQTTVSRNLQVLEKSGYVHLESEATDQRIRRIRVSDIGVSKVEEARPLWEKAQQEMERILGGEGIEELLGNLRKIAG
jgi:MarR family transcriptional regulator, organic hydroperoxide resistance regulator